MVLEKKKKISGAYNIKIVLDNESVTQDENKTKSTSTLTEKI